MADSTLDPTSQDLQDLLDLAGTDAAIRRLNVALANLPEQQELVEVANRRTAVEEAHADVRLERDRVTTVARTHDREVGLLNERLAAEQQRLYGGDITNAKELGKMEAEIAAVTDRIEEHELAELEALEQLEELEETIDGLEGEITGLGEQAVEVQGRLDAAATGLMAEIAEHEVVRDRQREDLDPALLARYDEVASRITGDAVGRLDGERCTACGIGLSYADVNDLMEGPPLATCPNCRRLIVVE